MAGMDIPPQLKNEIVQLQTLQQQMQMMQTQKQQIQIQINEIDRALNYLATAKPESKIYRSIGSILVSSEKEDATKAMNEQKETFSVRVKSIETQEQRLRERLNQLQKKVNDAIRDLEKGGQSGNVGVSGQE